MKKLMIFIFFLSFLVSCTPSYEDLKAAIENGNVQLVFKYIEKNVNLNDNSEGVYPLFIALKESDFEITKYLIENGADVNIKDENGKTPLLIALLNNDLKLLKLLVENGASVNIQIDSDKGSKPLILELIEFKNEEFAKVILSGNQDYNIVGDKNRGIAFKTVAYSSLEFLKHIIDIGIPIDMLDDNGQSPLVLALERGFINKAKLLIDSGAIIDNYTRPWSSLVHHWNGEVAEIAEIYLKKGISIDKDIDFPIWRSVTYAKEDAMKWFLEHGFDPKRENESGETPIDYVWKIYSRDEEEDKPLALVRNEMYSLLNQYGAIEKNPSWF